MHGVAVATAVLVMLSGVDMWPTRTAAARLAAAPAQPKPVGKFLTQPLVTDIYTADPSAHVFNGRIFIYPSHDIDAGVKPDDLGSHFAMRDYHVFSMDRVGGAVTDHGVALDIKNVPWAGRQMWAPDAAEKGGRYYLYFPVKDKEDVFRIGVAVGECAAGAVQGAGRADQGHVQHRSGGVQGLGRPVLHVLRRHLGRAAAALGDGIVRREGRLPGEGSAGDQRQGGAARRRHDHARRITA